MLKGSEQMEYQEINTIIEEIDKSLEKQISLMTQQLGELKTQIITMEKLITELKTKNA
jgi:hypothetical protein